MSKVKVELNQAGVRELLRSDEMKQICAEHAQAAQSRCGSGYEMDTYTGRNRVNAMIYAATAEAQSDNAENNTILRALR